LEMDKLGEIDAKLVILLQDDALQSRKMLAAQLGISPASVRRRVRVLRKEGVIRIVAVIDPGNWGLHLCAIVGLNVNIKKLDSVVEALSTLEPVRNVSTVTGRFEVLIFVRVASIEELSNLMRHEITRIDGVLNTQIFLCIQDIANQEALAFSDMESVFQCLHP